MIILHQSYHPNVHHHRVFFKSMQLNNHQFFDLFKSHWFGIQGNPKKMISLWTNENPKYTHMVRCTTPSNHLVHLGVSRDVFFEKWLEREIYCRPWSGFLSSKTNKAMCIMHKQSRIWTNKEKKINETLQSVELFGWVWWRELWTLGIVTTHFILVWYIYVVNEKEVQRWAPHFWLTKTESAESAL